MSKFNVLFFTMLGLFALPALSHTNSPEAVPGEYVVMFNEGTDLSSKSLDLESQYGIRIKKVIPEENTIIVQRPSIETMDSATKQLSTLPNVEAVEPNYIYRISKTPNDPMYKNLWGLSNGGQADSRGQAGKAGIDINVEKAWDIQTGSKKVIVAVIDTGVDYNNPNVKNNMWVNQKEANGQPGVDDDKNGYVDDVYGYDFVNNKGTPMDDHGHGTHCAATIGASGNDGVGLSGVAWNVRIMALKFLSAEGGGTLEDAVKAIAYATKMKARILSNSWGGGPASKALEKVIRRAAQRDILFVAAAGNETNNNDKEATYPAGYNVPNVLSVAAIDNRGVLASFSNYGKKKVHVGAPGVNIVSAVTNNKYASWSGTSMATPHVSGVAALVASEFPSMSAEEIKDRIIKTVHRVQSLAKTTKSGGVVDAYAALTQRVTKPDPNDPWTWSHKKVAVASAHPYVENTKQEFEVNVKGARQIALYFQSFETENRLDTVKLYDKENNELQVMSGRNNDSYSAVIEGDYVKIVFQTDDSVNGDGFEISKVAYRK